MRLLGIVSVACALTISGCAMSPRSTSRAHHDKAVAPTTEEDEQALREAIEDLKKAKSDIVVPRASSDCQPVCRLAELICDASERICSIAARHKAEPTYTQSCEEAEEDCRKARLDCERCQ